MSSAMVDTLHRVDTAGRHDNICRNTRIPGLQPGSPNSREADRAVAPFTLINDMGAKESWRRSSRVSSATEATTILESQGAIPLPTGRVWANQRDASAPRIPYPTFQDKSLGDLSHQILVNTSRTVSITTSRTTPGGGVTRACPLAT
jgi:hypothetical protein